MGLINSFFDLFARHQILQFDNAKNVPIHFIGSIAFYLKEELAEVLSGLGLTIGNVHKKPIEGLVEYHLKTS